jgi:glycosyltransferase involved in cell wall biosynthesis
MISVVVSTCNRATRLPNLLASLSRMSVPTGLAWELVLVDNNSTDDTRDVMLRFASRAPFACRYVFEGRQGLSHARNRGVAEARGDIIACVDDDCLVDEAWLVGIAGEFAQDASLLVLGGRVELYDPGDARVTIRTGRERLDLSRNAAAVDHIIGCNIAFRRSAFERVGGFDVRFGVGSGTVPSYEDCEFVYRVVRHGGGIVYAPNVLVLHHHGRRDGPELDSLHHGYAAGRGGFYADYIRRADWLVLRMACSELVERAVSILSPRTTAARRAAQINALHGLFEGAVRMIRFGGAASRSTV